MELAARILDLPDNFVELIRSFSVLARGYLTAFSNAMCLRQDTNLIHDRILKVDAFGIILFKSSTDNIPRTLLD